MSLKESIASLAQRLKTAQQEERDGGTPDWEYIVMDFVHLIVRSFHLCQTK